MTTDIVGELLLPSLDGREVAPDVFLLGEPSPRPDLGPNKMACLANVRGELWLVELSMVFRERQIKKERKSNA